MKISQIVYKNYKNYLVFLHKLIVVAYLFDKQKFTLFNYFKNSIVYIKYYPKSTIAKIN